MLHGGKIEITGYESNVYILREVGDRIKETRLSLNLSREDLSHKAGLSVNTILRIENGENASFENLMGVLRALEILSNINYLVPEVQYNPFAKQKKRASKKSINKSTWIWEEDK